MSTATVDYIAKAIGCEATKTELTNQLKDNAEAMDKALVEFKAKAKAEAEARKTAKAEAEAEKQKKLQELTKKAEEEKQKQKDSKKDNSKKDSKQTQKDSKKDNSKQTDRQKAQAEKKQAVVDTFNSADIELKEDSKKNKYTLFYKLTADKSRGVVEIFVTAKEYHICSKVKFAGSEYHDSWGFKYDNRYTDIKEVKKVVNTILKDYKAEQKKKEAEKKQKKAEDKKNEK